MAIASLHLVKGKHDTGKQLSTAELSNAGVELVRQKDQFVFWKQTNSFFFKRKTEIKRETETNYKYTHI